MICRVVVQQMPHDVCAVTNVLWLLWNGMGNEETFYLFRANNDAVIAEDSFLC